MKKKKKEEEEKRRERMREEKKICGNNFSIPLFDSDIHYQMYFIPEISQSNI